LTATSDANGYDGYDEKGYDEKGYDASGDGAILSRRGLMR
jgi:hypothetical protein